MSGVFTYLRPFINFNRKRKMTEPELIDLFKTLIPKTDNDEIKWNMTYEMTRAEYILSEDSSIKLKYQTNKILIYFTNKSYNEKIQLKTSPMNFYVTVNRLYNAAKNQCIRYDTNRYDDRLTEFFPTSSK